MAVAIGQLPALRLWATLDALGWAIAGRDVIILRTGRRVGPVVTEGAEAERTLWLSEGAGYGGVVVDAAPRLGGMLSTLLGVEGRGEGIDLALELGDATVGLFLALAGWGRGDTRAICLCAAPARLVGSFLVAAHLQTSTRVAGARTLDVVRRFG